MRAGAVRKGNTSRTCTRSSEEASALGRNAASADWRNAKVQHTKRSFFTANMFPPGAERLGADSSRMNARGALTKRGTLMSPREGTCARSSKNPRHAQWAPRFSEGASTKAFSVKVAVRRGLLG